MTNLEQALTYIHRELRFMAIDPSGAANRHRFADKVIEDVTDVPNLCSSSLAAAKPLAPILNAVRGPRGNALMKFFNVSLHDTRMEMTMVVAEATRLQGGRSRKTEDAYDYLSSMYRTAVRKARKLVHGRAENQESYLDKYTNLQKFTGFGGAGLNDYDIDDDDDGDTGFFMGDSGYAEEALNALRNGDPVPMPQSPWGVSTGYPGAPLEGNANIINQIRAIEAQIGHPLTDSELDSFLTGEKMISPMPASQNFDEQFFADLGRFQNGQSVQPATQVDAAKEAAIQMIMSGAIDLRDIAKLVSKNATDGELEEAPAAVTVDPEALRAAAPAASPIDTDLEALIRARNNLSPRTSPAQTDPAPAPETPPDKETTDEESDSSSNNGGPDVQSGPPSEVSDNASAPDTPEYTPSLQASGMKYLIDTIGAYTHDDFRMTLRNIFETAESELADALIAVTSSSDPDKLLTLVIYAKAVRSAELVNPMTVNIAAIGYAKKIAHDLDISPDLIDEEIHITNAADIGSINNDLSEIYGNKLVFWYEGIQRNLGCAAMIAVLMHKYCNFNLRVDYVSDYPKAFGKERLTYVYSLYPKTDGVSFDAIRNAFNSIDPEVWKLFIQYFNDVSDVPLARDLQSFSIAIRVPTDIETEKYLDDYEDLQSQVIRGESIALIPGLQYLISRTMKFLTGEIENDPTEPAEVTDAQFDYCAALAKENLVYEFNLKICTKTKLSDERKEEICSILKSDYYSSAAGEIAMLASASRVKFETYVQIIDPREEESEETAGDAATQAVEDLVGSLTPNSGGDGLTQPEAQTNAFGLQ